jgi:hypothetical protein
VAVSFDQTGKVIGIITSGPFVNSERRSEAAARVDANPNWSDERIISVLREMGAQFAPGAVSEPQAFFGARLTRLEPLVGRIDLRSTIEFKFRDDNQAGAGLRAADLYWLADFTAFSSGERSRRFLAWFEPFGGELTQLTGF